MSAQPDRDIVRDLRDTVLRAMAETSQLRRERGEPPLTRHQESEYARHVILDALSRRAETDVSQGRDGLSPAEEAALVDQVLALMFGMGKLDALLKDERVEGIDVNGADTVWVTYTGGRVVPADPVADNDDELIRLVQHLAAYEGLSERAFDRAHPLLSLRLQDGSRLVATMGVSVRPSLSIRRNRLPNLSLDDLVERGTLDEHLRSFLGAVVRARCNIMIAGATAAGKTTLLRALAAELPEQERIITVERTLELELHKGRHRNVVALEERPPNLQGAGGIKLSDLARQALGMNPSRVIVGEVSGPEIVVMLQAMTQGNDGSLSTIHARSPQHVGDRIHTYAATADERLPADAIDRLIAGGLDFVVFVQARPIESATGSDDLLTRRLVTHVTEITDGGGRPAYSNIFASTSSDTVAQPTGTATTRISRLMRAGYSPGAWSHA
ncbi:MAG TPA: ATPase, T2SS/T4P/T4SS family [Mycobacteriales bacterium]|jgi:Flp pilus assembly CpaF family ATPase|nr:ATPase, T2SS/T4P/T4SS family [Mycobacteriales bacterium]